MTNTSERRAYRGNGTADVLSFQDVMAATLDDKRIQLWAITDGNQLYSTVKDTTDPNSKWQPWSNFAESSGAGKLPQNPARLAAAQQSNGRLQLFVVSVTGEMFTTWKKTTDPNSSWTSWEKFLTG